MTVSRLGSVAAVLGGVTWIVVAVLAWGEPDPDGPAYVAGYGLLLVAGAALGYSLVAKAPLWLRAVVTLATAALGAMLWLILDDLVTDAATALLVAGILLLLGGAIGLGRGAGSGGGSGGGEAPVPPVRGRRAAR